MSAFVRCFRAELVKSRRSALLAAHLVLPLLFAAVFAAYFRLSAWPVFSKISAYPEALAVSLPFLQGLVTARAVQREQRAGRCQLLLGVLPSRSAAFLGKLSFLLSALFVALVLALGAFALFYPAAPAALYGKILLFLLLTSLPLCVIHLFTALRFGTGATLGLSIAGSLLSALMLTGLGDALWRWIPWAWGVRAVDYLLLSRLDPPRFELLRADFSSGTASCVCMSLCLLLACLLWFRRWDGGKNGQ